MTSYVKCGWDIADNTFDGLLSKEAVFCFVFYNVSVIDTSTVLCSLKRDVCDICS